MLTSRFEEIRMKDDESFDEFYAKLNDIVNSSFNLGEKILESKIVRKILRSLPEKFRPKVKAIEESEDLDTVKIEELIGSLQTYELTISQPKKNKSIALNTIGEEKSESFDIETLRDVEIAYFGRRKALVVSLTDDDSNASDQRDSSSSEDEKGYMAFVSTVKSESDKESEKVEEDVESKKSNDDTEDETDIHEAYQLLFKESLKIKKCVNEKLEDKVKTLTCELEKSRTQLQSFMSGTKKLDNLLGMNKPTGNRYGENSNCFVAHVAYKAQNTYMRYLDSACPRHMCGNKALFSTFDDCNGGVVTFGDGATAPICEGLKFNLLSISQICDADYEVSFVEKRCIIYDSSSGVVLEGVRTSDNCYRVLPNSNYVFSSAKIDMTELWHQRLGHVNYKSMSKLVKKKIVDG
ncbi:uncharacterized protein LOC111393087 [Olea europaea var. sylvestris]|uniref:uncharacterized protein LOC111393087 n=1 Tax=Olea europaea var. sylvestris TaxID=158386 RepID=UPI000C1D61B5|nr:uncharacterized protein LOC111393087 [Olea europaea var. sylvestris]